MLPVACLALLRTARDFRTKSWAMLNPVGHGSKLSRSDHVGTGRKLHLGPRSSITRFVLMMMVQLVQ